MALKNFSFRKNWVGSEVAGTKIAFFAIFDPTWAYILPPQKAKIWNSLSRTLIFCPLERQKLYYYQVCNLKTD